MFIAWMLETAQRLSFGLRKLLAIIDKLVIIDKFDTFGIPSGTITLENT